MPGTSNTSPGTEENRSADSTGPGNSTVARNNAADGEAQPAPLNDASLADNPSPDSSSETADTDETFGAEETLTTDETDLSSPPETEDDPDESAYYFGASEDPDPAYDPAYPYSSYYEPPPETEPESASDAESESQFGGVARFVFDHLESLRRLAIRSATAFGIALVLCLVFADQCVDLLTWPIEVQPAPRQPRHPVLSFEWEGKPLWQTVFPTNHFGALALGSNGLARYELTPVRRGTNTVLGLRPATAKDPPLPPPPHKLRIALNNYGPLGGFTAALDIALYGGLALSSPFLIYFLGQFLLPLLGKDSTVSRYLVRGAVLGTLLFFAGVVFCYLVLLRVGLTGSAEFSRWLTFAADEWRAEDYISFVCKFLLGMGLGFELPLVILILVKAGILNYQQLKKFRAYWVVLNMVASAFITPDGSPLTMCLMAVPLQLLYEISVGIAWYWERKARKAAATAQAPGAA